jgi:hypothetical protein
MPDQKSQQDAAPNTALPAAVPIAGQAVPAVPVEDQPRMCCAVGDLSCVVPVVATPEKLPGQREEGDAPKTSAADEPSATRP